MTTDFTTVFIPFEYSMSGLDAKSLHLALSSHSIGITTIVPPLAVAGLVH